MLFARASSFAEVLAAYEWADVVCLPLTENDHSSGITVALEATYAGRPVLMTDVGGLGSYLPTLAQFALPSAADAGMWRERLQSFRSTTRGELSKMLEAAQKDAADLELTSKGYSERLLEVTKQLLKLSPNAENTVKRAS
jgi:glycosyltransferase involved in cell wall biosynthesis